MDKAKTTYVVSSLLVYGLLRMLEMRMEPSSKIQLRIFFEVKDAESRLKKYSE